MENKQNNYAFIDSQNLNLAIRDQGWILDWKQFNKYLREKYQVTRAYLFIGYVVGNHRLYEALEKCGYALIFKPTMDLPDGRVKGNVDAELVLQAMIEYPNYEKAVIVTGDGDFYCLIDYLQRQDKLLRVLVPNVRKYSKLLKPFAPNKLDFMNHLQNKLAYKQKSP